MKILQQLQNALAIYGIAAHQQPFNWRNLMAFFIFSCAIASNGIFIFYEAKSFQEYAESIFMATALIAVSICFVYIVLKMHRLFDCLNEMEKLINGSEF